MNDGQIEFGPPKGQVTEKISRAPGSDWMIVESRGFPGWETLTTCLLTPPTLMRPGKTNCNPFHSEPATITALLPSIK